jgi:hypothetical protein
MLLRVDMILEIFIVDSAYPAVLVIRYRYLERAAYSLYHADVTST